VALPDVALPIARGQSGCLTQNPQSARPLIRSHEREANGTKQDKRGDHSGSDTLPRSPLAHFLRQAAAEPVTRLIAHALLRCRAVKSRTRMFTDRDWTAWLGM
jgi:hypothetical protein